jgi:hypothetical protein
MDVSRRGSWSVLHVKGKFGVTVTNGCLLELCHRITKQC